MSTHIESAGPNATRATTVIKNTKNICAIGFFKRALELLTKNFQRIFNTDKFFTKTYPLASNVGFDLYKINFGFLQFTKLWNIIYRKSLQHI